VQRLKGDPERFEIGVDFRTLGERSVLLACGDQSVLEEFKSAPVG